MASYLHLTTWFSPSSFVFLLSQTSPFYILSLFQIKVAIVFFFCIFSPFNLYAIIKHLKTCSDSCNFLILSPSHAHAESCSTLYNLLDCSPPGSSVHEIFLGKNPGVGCHFLFQGIFLTCRSNPHLLHCKWILYH